MKKLKPEIILIPLCVMVLSSASMFEQGEKLLLNNQLSEAIVMFEGALEQDPMNTRTYFYLGNIYEIRKEYSSAVNILTKGLNTTGKETGRFYFEIGNNYFKDGDYISAADMYSRSIQNSSGFADPYLNRANSRVKSGDYTLAARDYRLYLNMVPASSQKTEIEKMISILELTVAEDERLRAEEEARRLAEEARQKALLDSVLQSLSNAGEDTTNISAESEDIEDIEVELDIED